MAKRRSRRQRDVETARAEAKVRFGPERRSLNDTLQEARDELDSGVQQANYSAEATRRAVRDARPLLEGHYKQAADSATQAKSLLDHDLSRLSDAADPFKAASARESAGAAGRLGSAMASALDDLTKREVGSQAGRDYAISGLRGQYGRNREKVISRILDLDREEGAYVAGRTGTLSEERAKRKVTIRGQNVTSRDKALDREATAAEKARDRASRERIAREKGKPKGPKINTPKDHGAVQDRVNQAQSAARAFIAAFKSVPANKGKSPTRQQVQAVLSAGDEAAGIPKLGGQPLYLQAGLDLVFEGGLSPATTRALRKRRFSVKTLGFAYSNRAASESHGGRTPRGGQ